MSGPNPELRRQVIAIYKGDRLLHPLVALRLTPVDGAQSCFTWGASIPSASPTFARGCTTPSYRAPPSGTRTRSLRASAGRSTSKRACEARTPSRDRPADHGQKSRPCKLSASCPHESSDCPHRMRPFPRRCLRPPLHYPGCAALLPMNLGPVTASRVKARSSRTATPRVTMSA